jgi:hypothetical protein
VRPHLPESRSCQSFPNHALCVGACVVCDVSGGVRVSDESFPSLYAQESGVAFVLLQYRNKAQGDPQTHCVFVRRGVFTRARRRRTYTTSQLRGLSSRVPGSPSPGSRGRRLLVSEVAY